MTQLSNDCFAHTGRLMPVGEALERLERTVAQVTEAESVPVAAALGRVLAEDVIPAHDVPPHDNTAVDGYAVRFDDLAPDRETSLPVIGRVAAGQPLDGPAPAGAAVRIFTGAPMPEGADTVFMQEDCRREGERVILPPGIARGANRRRRGEDLTAGRAALRAGRRLRPQDLGQAAAAGRRDVMVSCRLRVALMSTGDELRTPGAPLDPGCIYDSNRFIAHGLLAGLGCAVSDLGIVEDRAETVCAALAAAARENDLIITSGGVSVGEEDHVKPAVESLGALHIWRLAIKPGRPIALGQVGRVPFVGLPGNPVAAMITFLILVRPMILRLMGARDVIPRRFSVRADFAYKKKAGRREWLRARLEPDRDAPGSYGWRAVKFPLDGSGILTSMVDSDGLIELSEDVTRVRPGDVVEYLPFSEVCS